MKPRAKIEIIKGACIRCREFRRARLDGAKLPPTPKAYVRHVDLMVVQPQYDTAIWARELFELEYDPAIYSNPSERPPTKVGESSGNESSAEMSN